MARLKLSWREKLKDDKGLPRVEPITGSMSRRWGEGLLVIPAPVEVDEVMRGVRKGKVITINAIRKLLARKHGADVGCPITTGIFAWIAANAAEEDATEGRKRVTPWWRTLKSDGEMNPKYPGGIARQKRLLRAEGHRFERRGKRWFVSGYAGRLAAPE